MNVCKNKKITILIFICFLILSIAFVCSTTVVSAKSEVKIGQATNGEGGRLSGCKAGDQSGGEVSISTWSYSKGTGSSYHWVYVFRAKDPEVALALAENMKQAAANNHVGYDKKNPDRCSFYDQAKAVNWDISKITTNCETTCASAVSVCLNAAGVNVPRMWYSAIVYKDIMKTGQFYCYTSSDYTASDQKLLPGDILCNPNRHTAMVVESPNPFIFGVDYQKTDGTEGRARVEEGKTITLSNNNGDDTEEIVVKGMIDLESYEPKKNGYTFKGWKKVGENNFSAQYSADTAPIRTSGKIKQLEK